MHVEPREWSSESGAAPVPRRADISTETRPNGWDHRPLCWPCTRAEAWPVTPGGHWKRGCAQQAGSTAWRGRPARRRGSGAEFCTRVQNSAPKPVEALEMFPPLASSSSSSSSRTQQQQYRTGCGVRSNAEPNIICCRRGATVVAALWLHGWAQRHGLSRRLHEHLPWPRRRRVWAPTWTVRHECRTPRSVQPAAAGGRWQQQHCW